MNNFTIQHQIDRKISRSRVKSRQFGFALVLVLWVMSLLTIMAGSFALTMRRESAIVAGIKNNAAAIAAAEAGIAVGETMLSNPEQNKRWRADGSIYQLDFGDTQVRLRMLSETGKIDLNKAAPAMLKSFMAQAPIEEDQQAKLIGAILDWRDHDDLVSTEGAEKKEYRDAGLKYQPRNKPFQTLEELQMVLGMDERVYNWMEPLVTVYSGQAQVNTSVASGKVLSMLPDVDASVIESYLAARLESAKNDQPAPAFQAGLPGGGGPNSNETVTIVSDALMANGTGALVAAIVSKPDANQAALNGETPPEPFQVLKWQRNPVNGQSLFTDTMSELLVKQYAEPQLSD